MKNWEGKLFPTLYALNNDLSIQQWTITVIENRINKSYGKVGGKIQTTTDTIEKGKNIGKINGTTPETQAIAEAQSQWEKKLKSGYCKTEVEARQGKVDKEFVTGGVEPMLAHKFRDHESKISYMAYCQPKLDGIRCVAVVSNGTCTLWSRTRKPITSVPHIIKALEKTFPDQGIVLDGELYNHEYKNKFEEIVSLVRQEKPKPECEIVQYHVYDVISNYTFSERINLLDSIKFADRKIVHVETRKVKNAEELMSYFDIDRKNGYEGTMVRNAMGIYENKRSYNLQKIKEMADDEFEIIGVEGGRGRMVDCGIFLCKTKGGHEFSCKMKGSLDVLKTYLSNPEKVIGKMLTVKYQGMTNGAVPRFPIGVCVRDYE